MLSFVYNKGADYYDLYEYYNLSVMTMTMTMIKIHYKK